MKTKKIIATALAAGAVAACLCIAPSSASKVDNATVHSIEQQIAENAQKQAELDAALKNIGNELDSAWEKKLAIDNYYNLTMQQKTALETLISQLETEIAELSALDIETTGRIEDQRAAFLARMASLHEDGNASYLELILGAEDITTFLTKYDYVNSMLEYDRRVIADLKEAKKALAKTREEKEAVLATKKASIERLQSEEQRLLALEAEANAVISQIEADQNYYQNLYNDAAAIDNQLNSQLTEMLLEIQRQEEIAKQEEANKNQEQNQPPSNPNVPDDGTFMWPLNTGYISSSYGYREFNGGEDHLATDIAAETGTPIFASSGGTVVVSEYHDSYGNYVLINHGNGVATLYAHMSQRASSVGQYVSKGEVIGYVGNTGFSFGSHLHFEYRINGERVDAELYVPH